VSEHFDVIVVDRRSAGEHCAGSLADGGLRVALVERELVGGECSSWGCIPSHTRGAISSVRGRATTDRCEESGNGSPSSA
jgi:pyruvate/2-oxoglutarate dehydrogenase complex dihydrolipoamide dehydrogenase (E3) component